MYACHEEPLKPGWSGFSLTKKLNYFLNILARFKQDGFSTHSQWFTSELCHLKTKRSCLDCMHTKKLDLQSTIHYKCTTITFSWTQYSQVQILSRFNQLQWRELRVLLCTIDNTRWPPNSLCLVYIHWLLYFSYYIIFHGQSSIVFLDSNAVFDTLSHSSLLIN